MNKLSKSVYETTCVWELHSDWLLAEIFNYTAFRLRANPVNGGRKFCSCDKMFLLYLLSSTEKSGVCWKWLVITIMRGLERSGERVLAEIENSCLLS